MEAMNTVHLMHAFWKSIDHVAETKKAQAIVFEVCDTIDGKTFELEVIIRPHKKQNTVVEVPSQ